MPPFSSDMEDLPSKNELEKSATCLLLSCQKLYRWTAAVLCDSQLQQLAEFTGTSYDILMGYFGKKEASGLKIGLLRRIDVLKGFVDKIRAVWVENGTFREY